MAQSKAGSVFRRRFEVGASWDQQRDPIHPHPASYVQRDPPMQRSVRRDKNGASCPTTGKNREERAMAQKTSAQHTSGSTPAFFEDLFDSSPDGILVLAADGSIREANPQVQRLFGYSREELLGSAIGKLIPELKNQPSPESVDGNSSGLGTRPMRRALVLYGQPKTGDKFPIEVLLSTIEVDGAPQVLAVLHDVSDRNRLEQGLRESDERFRLLIEGTRDYAIFMLDPKGNVASWNPGAERIKGYRADEILGRHFSCFYLSEDAESGKPARELELAEKEGRYEDEGWRVRKDGSRFWANVIITALRGPAGELIGFSKVTRDFTTRKTAEESLLVELGNAVFSCLDARRILTVIAAGLHRIVPSDYAAIALYDSEARSLRVQGLLQGVTDHMDERVLPIEGTPAGWAFQNRRALSLERMEPDRFSARSLLYFHQAGIKSACWAPLYGRDRILGILIVGSRHESAFDSKRTDAVSEFSRQVSAALDNVQAYQRIAGLASKLQEEKRYLEEEIQTEYGFEEIVGESPDLKRVLKQAEAVAPTDATVLIEGETGTGKELIARAIHQLSPRRDRTFVKLNCSAIPLGLLESELFGHEKGAFTGAIAQRIGRLELAHTGTLFLDEIGDLPLELQPKILRAIQEREFERLGGKRTIPVDVRLVAATNRNLAQMVQAGEFRSDLYYRLKVFPILLPPLRMRSRDIPLLVNYFVNKHSRRMNRPISVIPDNVMDALVRWRWPGNVRELENFIERAVILSRGNVLNAPLAELVSLGSPDTEVDENLQSAEREHILRILRETSGVIGGAAGAAERLGVKRTTLNSKLRKLGIKREDFN